MPKISQTHIHGKKSSPLLMILNISMSALLVATFASFLLYSNSLVSKQFQMKALKNDIMKTTEQNNFYQTKLSQERNLRLSNEELASRALVPVADSQNLRLYDAALSNR